MPSIRIAIKREALRQRIIEAALKAFSARGFDATTTVDIADQLQMTGPALYHYFRTKDDLLYACVDHLLEALHQTLAKAAAGPGSAAERMARMVRAQVALELKHGSAAPLVNAHLYGPKYLTDLLTPERREALRLRQRALVQLFRDLINEGAKSGEFQVADTAAASFNVLAIIQYASVWYRPRRGRRAADMIDAQAAAVLQLLGHPPPAARKARP